MMATDYDAPRRPALDEPDDEPVEELRRHNAARRSATEADVPDSAESFELPGADLSGLSGEELTVSVVAQQDDEFTCMTCFLVQHRSRLVTTRGRRKICRDCA